MNHPYYIAIFILILAGAFTKSAQFPVHFWLPNAMAAPTPVSAFLHSATMVKAGIYLMARLHPSLSGTEVWFWTLTIFGAFTALYASVLALRQTDLKQALAYTTLMALGTLTMLLGQNSGAALTAFLTFLIVHSLYKAGLFLVVGCIDQVTGTRDVDALSGLGRLGGQMPLTALAAGLAALSMAGMPPLLGFISKELQYVALETLGQTLGQRGLIFMGMAVLANALMIAVAGIVAFRPFFGGASLRQPTAPIQTAAQVPNTGGCAAGHDTWAANFGLTWPLIWSHAVAGAGPFYRPWRGIADGGRCPGERTKAVGRGQFAFNLIGANHCVGLGPVCGASTRAQLAGLD